jgi:hypothetical protein
MKSALPDSLTSYKKVMYKTIIINNGYGYYEISEFRHHM